MTEYIRVKQPDHPHADSDGRVYEHRLVMEQFIGRYLTPEEQVHHKDEDKRNNDISNLELCANQKEHSEQHAYDNDEMIDLLIRFSDIYGHLPSKKECDRESGLPHSSTYIRHFGSWSGAKQLAQDKIDAINYEEVYHYA